MAQEKVVRCRDVGFDCNGVVRADTEQELMQKVADHAKSVHNVNEINDDMVNKVKSVTREEEKKESN